MICNNITWNSRRYECTSLLSDSSLRVDDLRPQWHEGTSLWRVRPNTAEVSRSTSHLWSGSSRCHSGSLSRGGGTLRFPGLKSHALCPLSHGRVWCLQTDTRTHAAAVAERRSIPTSPGSGGFAALGSDGSSGSPVSFVVSAAAAAGSCSEETTTRLRDRNVFSCKGRSLLALRRGGDTVTAEKVPSSLRCARARDVGITAASPHTFNDVWDGE